MESISFFKKLILLFFLSVFHFSLYALSIDEMMLQGVNEKSIKVKITLFSKIISSKDADTRKKALAYYNRGVAYYLNNNIAEAMNDFETSLKLKPNDADSIKNIGLIHLRAKRYANAISRFSELIDINSDNAEPFFLRGNVFYAWQKHSKAISDYTKAIELDPNHIKALSNRGWSFIFNKQFGKALEDFERILKIDPYDEYALKGKEKILATLDSIES